MKLTLESRLERLKKDRDQTIANLNAIGGAIQTIEELIAERDKPEPKDEKP